MLERLRVDALASERDGDRAVLIDRFRGMLSRLVEIGESARTPEATRNKARTFLGLVEEAHRRLGDALFQPSYLLNVVGEAFVKARFIAEPIVEFLQVGLYFHGIRQIERRFRSRAAGYLGAHAVLVSSYVSRPSLKALLDEGERRLAEGKVFCLTYHYLNALKAEYFRTLRASQDALDHVEPETALQQFEGPSAARGAVEPSDRVGLMLEIFATRLTATQQKVYLAKNRSSQDAAGFRDVPAFEPFRQLFEGLNDELDGHGNLGWSEIAARLSVNEKTAKREYVRALHILLRETAHAVFGLNITSNYVRRVLEQLRVVVAAKDLRIRSATGDGLPRLVEKWEVALRFVLNHDRALA